MTTDKLRRVKRALTRGRSAQVTARPCQADGGHHREVNSRWWRAVAEATATAAEHTYSRSLSSRRLVRSVNALSGAVASRASRAAVAAGDEPLVRLGAAPEKRAALDVARDARVAGESGLAVAIASLLTETDPGSRLAWTYLATTLRAEGHLREAAEAEGRGVGRPELAALVGERLIALESALAATTLDLPPVDAGPAREGALERAASALESRTMLDLAGAVDSASVAVAHRALAQAAAHTRWSTEDVLSLDLLEAVELRAYLVGRRILVALDGADPEALAAACATADVVVRFDDPSPVEADATIRVLPEGARSGWDLAADVRWVVAPDDDAWHTAIARSVIPGAQEHLVGVWLRAPLMYAIGGRHAGTPAYGVVRALESLDLEGGLDLLLPASEMQVPADLAAWLATVDTVAEGGIVRMKGNR